MFIKRGMASGTKIGVEATQVGTVPIVVDGNTVQEPIYDVASCQLMQARTKRVATVADRRASKQVLPHEIAGDLTVEFRFADETVTVTLDESRDIQAVRLTAKTGVFLPAIKITWRDRSQRRTT